ncbi:Putative peptidase S8/S53 domain, peptidase S8, subtilisin, His-active [Colletotrichum destructivum]|uniref:Peptidase S8/S53 domain, peptidase S8, subtilisin, His-active n=1 Tax=Colletotrichum destructivum TaxID=34406 RepID=A0AAX4I299_9PEZI|nr:Putative peptidase S8/S53 domain, peptidase S8, subtilisin, His-active [Colletotrichum destructivum]
MKPLRFLAVLFTLISPCLSQELPHPSKPTSATPTGTYEAKYIIRAKQGISKEDADGFHNTLVGIVGDEDEVKSIVNEKDIPYIWLTALTAAQLKKVNSEDVVKSAELEEQLVVAEEPDVPTANKRRDIVNQAPTADNPIIDLRMLSTPPGNPFVDHHEYNEHYGYDDVAGQGITIYIIDTGPFRFAHSELRPPDSSVTRRNIDVVKDPSVINGISSHGTCVASKAVGKTVGVAKRANLVTVRVDPTPGEFFFVKAWQAVFNDIKEKGLKGKAVVSTSTFTYVPREDKAKAELLSDMDEIMRKILGEDVPVVCGAGNDVSISIEPNKLPAILAKNLPIIVVGSATVDGTMAPDSQRGSLVTTWAVGRRIQCAGYNTLDGLVTRSGVSVAAPQIGGLAAYFLSNPKFKKDLRSGSIAEDMKALIKEKSYRRGFTDDHPAIAWNGFYPPCSTATRMRRSLGGAVRRQSSRACSGPESSLPAQPTGKATADPQCNVCGQLNKKIMRYEAGCPGADYARSSCEASSDCQSWAYGEEKQGARSTSICIMYSEAAAEVIAGAPVDTKKECHIRYSDKTCR